MMKINSYFEGTYPNITHPLQFPLPGGGQRVGWIEIGEVEYSDSFIRAFDEGGMIWGRKETYSSLDEAFNDLESALGDIMEDW